MKSSPVNPVVFTAYVLIIKPGAVRGHVGPNCGRAMCSSGYQLAVSSSDGARVSGELVIPQFLSPVTHQSVVRHDRATGNMCSVEMCGQPLYTILRYCG